MYFAFVVGKVINCCRTAGATKKAPTTLMDAPAIATRNLTSCIEVKHYVCYSVLASLRRIIWLTTKSIQQHEFQVKREPRRTLGTLLSRHPAIKPQWNRSIIFRPTWSKKIAATVRILNARPTWMDKTPRSSGDSFDGAPAIRLCSYRLLTLLLNRK